MYSKDENTVLENASLANTAVRKKHYLLITTCIILAVVAIVLCVSYFTQERVDEFDGTLVHSIAMNI
ncbi:MAG: hypothetical protein GX306_02270 [Clostridiales bacterium]|jgi:hypothetical protein|nr:hypothetical protein [Clostridiales bacterium]